MGRHFWSYGSETFFVNFLSMADASQIKKFFIVLKERFGLRGTVSARAMIRPMRDWKILFVVFIVLNGIIIVFSAFLFLEINKGEIFLVEPATPSGIDTVDRNALREILFSFEEKAEQFEALKTSRPTLADPSL